ncbi:MAG: hypothetical protein U0528_02665 [Anaerolineae bacterium]
MQTFIAQDALKEYDRSMTGAGDGRIGVRALAVMQYRYAILAIVVNPIAAIGGFTIRSIFDLRSWSDGGHQKSMAMYLGILHSRKTVLYMTLLPLLINVDQDLVEPECALLLMALANGNHSRRGDRAPMPSIKGEHDPFSTSYSASLNCNQFATSVLPTSC